MLIQIEWYRFLLGGAWFWIILIVCQPPFIITRTSWQHGRQAMVTQSFKVKFTLDGGQRMSSWNHLCNLPFPATDLLRGLLANTKHISYDTSCLNSWTMWIQFWLCKFLKDCASFSGGQNSEHNSVIASPLQNAFSFAAKLLEVFSLPHMCRVSLWTCYANIAILNQVRKHSSLPCKSVCQLRKVNPIRVLQTDLFLDSLQLAQVKNVCVCIRWQIEKKRK